MRTELITAAAVLTFGATTLLSLGVASCSPASEATAAASSPSADRAGLAALLQECGSTQTSVVTALEGTDRSIILHELAAAHSACSLAATKLRETPLPTINSTEVAAGMDEMTAGLDEIASGVRVMDSSPKRARAHAQSGMRHYKAGLDRLKRGQG